VETGGSNVQFAVDPARADVVIEMNPRVSRSSALASKRRASRSPRSPRSSRWVLARRDPERHHAVDASSFEPTLDYVVVKIPRWAFEKFPREPHPRHPDEVVGEAMAIARTFKEALQKALGRSRWGARVGADGRDGSRRPPQGASPHAELGADLLHPARAPERHVGGRDHELTRIDPWFLAQIEEILDVEARCDRSSREPRDAAPPPAKRFGSPTGSSGISGRPRECAATAARRDRGRVQARGHLRRRVRANTPTCTRPTRTRTSAIRPTAQGRDLGRRPNRIGQDRVDYCCCTPRSRSVRRDRERDGELQSGDRLHRLRTSDRLYFEPLTLEDVLRIVERRSRRGPRAVRGADAARAREGARGARRPDPRTSPDSIDLAEDRERFGGSSPASDPAPEWGTARSLEEAGRSREIGYPVLGGRVRPRRPRDVRDHDEEPSPHDAPRGRGIPEHRC